MARLHVEHRTRYDYEVPVSVSYNEARMTPQTDAQQVVLETNLEVSPPVISVASYRDYWGTRVHHFDVHAPHSHLQVTATAVIEVHRAERQHDPADLLDWEDLETTETIHEFSDFLPQSRLSEPGEHVRDAVQEIAAGKTPHETVHAVFAWLREEMEYQPGITQVHFNAEAAFRERRGVCQDLAHVAIGALRSLGLPARYVSGYIHPRPQAELGETVAGQSHAWLEWWDGRWHSWDPTNHKPAGDLHVLVARGRDYSDVSPFKGILSSGGGNTGLQVEVSIVRQA